MTDADGRRPPPAAISLNMPLTVWMATSSRKTVAPPLVQVLVNLTVWKPAVTLKAAVRSQVQAFCAAAENSAAPSRLLQGRAAVDGNAQPVIPVIGQGLAGQQGNVRPAAALKSTDSLMLAPGCR